MRTLIVSIVLCLVAALSTVCWLGCNDKASGVDPSASNTDATVAPATAALDSVDALDPAIAATGFVVEGQVTRTRVEHGDISPYSGVVLKLARENDRGFDDPVARTLTARDGTFRFKDVPPGRYRLIALAPGAPYEQEPVVLTKIEVVASPTPSRIGVHFGGVLASAPSGASDVAGVAPTTGAETMPAEEAPGTAQMAMALDQLIKAQTMQALALEGHQVMEGDNMVVQTLILEGGEKGEMNGLFGEVPILSGIWTAEAADAESNGTDATQPEPIEPEPERATIRGQALDFTTGQPLGGAQVKLRGRNVDWSISADQSGAFVFRNVEPGEYSVSLESLQSGSLFRSSPGNAILEIFAGNIHDVALRAERVLVIGSLTDEGQAVTAGMQPGDEMLSYGGVALTSQTQLRELRAAVPAEQQVEIVVRRSGQILSFTINGGTIGVYTNEIYR